MGGGVYFAGGTFNMSGGTISGNTAYYGGGVYFAGGGGTFAMNGGTISSNTAYYGGGVYVNGGTFTKTLNSIIYGDDDDNADNGNETDNTATANNMNAGHAVYVYNGPKIRNNTAGAGDGLDNTIAGAPGGWEE
jgi:hypothetical protein